MQHGNERPSPRDRFPYEQNHTNVRNLIRKLPDNFFLQPDIDRRNIARKQITFMPKKSGIFIDIHRLPGQSDCFLEKDALSFAPGPLPIARFLRQMLGEPSKLSLRAWHRGNIMLEIMQALYRRHPEIRMKLQLIG